VTPVNPQRRDFLKTVLRAGALAGLAGAVIPSLMRNRETCKQAGSCSECGQFGRCGLPEAVEHRTNAGRRAS
jgi:hypothetical protein